MRIIGIDYGTKRVGVSVSDETVKFALPLTVIANTIDLPTEIARLAAEHEAKDIVMGESRKYDMTANKILPDILSLKESLEASGLKVTLELEFMTSQQAERHQGKNDMTDASAAALILQAYLDRGGSESQA